MWKTSTKKREGTEKEDGNLKEAEFFGVEMTGDEGNYVKKRKS